MTSNIFIISCLEFYFKFDIHGPVRIQLNLFLYWNTAAYDWTWLTTCYFMWWTFIFCRVVSFYYCWGPSNIAAIHILGAVFVTVTLQHVLWRHGDCGSPLSLCLAILWPAPITLYPAMPLFLGVGRGGEGFQCWLVHKSNYVCHDVTILKC